MKSSISHSHSPFHWSPNVRFSLPKLSLNLNNLWQRLVNYLASQSEIKVWQSCDRQGDIIWHVYDPSSGQSSSFGSESDVRVWIEQRYYKTGF